MCVCVVGEEKRVGFLIFFKNQISLVLSPPRLQQNVVHPLPVPHYHRHRRLSLRQRSLGVIHHPHRTHRVKGRKRGLGVRRGARLSVRRISLLSPTLMKTRTKGRLLTVMSRADASRGRHLVAPNGLQRQGASCP